MISLHAQGSSLRAIAADMKAKGHASRMRAWRASCALDGPRESGGGTRRRRDAFATSGPKSRAVMGSKTQGAPRESVWQILATMVTTISANLRGGQRAAMQEESMAFLSRCDLP
jgi:hypothetical protein